MAYDRFQHTAAQSKKPSALSRDSMPDHRRPQGLAGATTDRALWRRGHARSGKSSVILDWLSSIAVLAAVGVAFAVAGPAEMQMEQRCRAYAPTDAACRQI